MDALDLSARPPRPTRDAIAGVMFLPRTIDKLRAELPGGNLNEYLTDSRGLSSYVLHRLGITFDDLRREIAAASSEDEVVAWLTARIDRAKAAEINAKLTGLRVDAMSPEDQALMYRRHPNVRPGQFEYVLDVIAAEDAVVCR